ncbi:nucleotidyltransferase family protein [Petroclostridium sp. X23]|uniref:nucleotidyltransferase family protein n=1 Tax=Petroclostridium sp. X23 TaxID=3045146 RepID=UPI0024AD7A1B|nr:nucleotidyltransferase family protein [Petroclostridium sp. X23]WHH57488.1 nucleotidyltransferase family protein [Petroclostridium sp. X23]
MKCILLAAGYATRLYPLTKDKPKSLLPVGGKTILEHIINKVERIDTVEDIYIVTNDRFYHQFLDWMEQHRSLKKIKILNDGTTNNDNRLGAIADIQYVIERENIFDDILVMAGDNLFDFKLTDFWNFYRTVASDCITAHELTDTNELKRTGVIEIDEEYRVISFEEKPQNPKSNLAVPPFYIYAKDTLKLVDKYLQEGNNPDAPGNFIPWLIQHGDVYVYKFEGKRYDIGTLESYEQAQKIFG